MIEQDIQDTYKEAKAMEDKSMDLGSEEEVYVHDEAENRLEAKGIKRIYTEEVNIDVY